MNDLKEMIKEDRLTARMLNKDQVNKEEISILTVLLGEIETIESRNRTELNDGQIISIIKKLIESCELTNEPKSVKILEAYLPSQLTEQEIEDIIKENPDLKLGDFMKYLKTEYDGRFDGKVASGLFRSINQ